MKPGFPAGPSLLWKLLLSTALIITLVFAATAWFVEDETLRAMNADLQIGMRAGFRAYESLWKARSDSLRSISAVLSNMPDVRAAFQTGDGATIRDSAAEIWSKASQSDAFFVVTDPGGRVIASLGGPASSGDLDIVKAAAKRFPAQSAGFSVLSGNLFELVITPVYVQSGLEGTSLLNVLVAGFLVDQPLADDLKRRTAGSDFVFRAKGIAVISTLPRAATQAIATRSWDQRDPRRIDVPGGAFAVLSNPLADISGRAIGDVLMVRSYAPVLNSIARLQRHFIWIWGTAILAAALMSSLIARRILRPVQDLDRAASRIADQDYTVRVPESGNDELGRLARTFNQMSASIRQASEELIRQERLNTIGRLAGSIVHDLRNPLASIYGGAEMLVDGELNEQQTQRVARNIYRSSRVINELLQELAEVSRGRMQAPEVCPLGEIAAASVAAQEAFAEQQNVTIRVDIPGGLEVLVERGRMERVFINLIGNAVEAMSDGGAIRIAAERDGESVVTRIRDSGPGIPRDIRSRLFQPFVSGGGNGLGLGLALARQTVRAHGGDLWLTQDSEPGACFCLRLPLARAERSTHGEPPARDSLLEASRVAHPGGPIEL